MRRIVLLLIALLSLCGKSLACSSAIVTAQRSSEGVPLLWKNRDSNFGDTRIEHIEGNKYAYTALVPNNNHYNRVLFAGINEMGLGFISTATGHLPKASKEEYAACERETLRGNIMWRGLCECATVDEFEQMLRTTKRRRTLNTNLGVADATGAVAYFEIWDLGYRRYDATSREEGFDVRINFSLAADPNKRGISLHRYNLIMQEMGRHKGDFSPQQFIGYSRSYKIYERGDILANDDNHVCNNYTVPRSATVASIVLVCDGKNPRMLVMNGHPVSSLAVPVYVKAKREIPHCVNGENMRLLSNDFRTKAYHKIANGVTLLQKELVRKVLKIKHPKIDMPREMPTNITSFNAHIDKLYDKHEGRVRKVLNKSRYTYPLNN